MNAALIRLHNNIDNLMEYINYNESVKSFFAKVRREDSELGKEAKQLSLTNSTSRVFEYNSYIISLYGFFESFLEDIARRYIENYPMIYSTYDDVPSTLRNVNLEKVTDLLGKLDLPKYQDLEAHNIVEVLNNNLNKNQPNICIEAFTHHNANFRPSSINEYFKPLGVSSVMQETGIINPMKKRLDNIHDNPAALSEEARFDVIQDLAERRNHIAHGVDTLDLMTPRAILSWCEYLKDFCESLCSSVQSQQIEEIINNKDKLPSHLVKQIEVINVYGNRILCFHSRNLDIRLGQNIIVFRETTNPKYKLKTIKSIRLDQFDLTRCPTYIDKPIGVGLENGIDLKDTFYLLEVLPI